MTSSAENAQSAAAHVDQRLNGLRNWVASIFGDDDSHIAPASADASFRRYFRITRGEQSWIAMDAPPEREDMQPYITIAGMLNQMGVNAPRVLHQNQQDGYLLNTDLGGQTYLHALENRGRAEQLYADAIDSLVLMQAGGKPYESQLPSYDDTILQREMRLFPEWFCSRHLDVTFSEAEEKDLQATFDVLARSALEQPRAFVHRDYHSRNLMVSDAGRHGRNPGILDFQDAVVGPITYDVVSLLRDCYVDWPIEKVHGWLDAYRTRAIAAGVFDAVSEAQLQRWFDLMGVQRHLKAIGIFARLWHRDGKAGYLKDIPRTLGYVTGVAARHDELAWLSEFIARRIAPMADRIPVAR
jgi:aminoglycoside/choline kinase family phosphotransferase